MDKSFLALEAVLFAMTFISGIISIGGETWIRGEQGHRGHITRRGWVAILAIAITVGLSFWKDYQAEKATDDAKLRERIAVLALDQLFSLNRAAVVKVKAQIGSEHREKSGFFVSPKGILVTADYAVSQPGHPEIPVSDIEVEDFQGNEYSAKIIEVDSRTSTAILKVDRDSPYCLRLADHPPQVGEQVLVIGSTEHEFLTRVTGKVATVAVAAGLYSRSRDFLPGFGGGPIVNLYGEVIGLNWGALVPPQPSIAQYVRADRIRSLIAKIHMPV